MIALSNLAFPADASASFLTDLRAFGVKGIEVAPTRIAPWDALSPARLRSYRALVAAHGLVVSSLQALFYQAEGVALLGDKVAFSRLIEHLRVVSQMASILGAPVGVLGAPKQRSRGVLLDKDAFALGTERLRHAAEVCWSEGRFVLGLEPVPATYGGDFLTTYGDVLALVRAVDHPALRVHLDTSCVLLGGGDIGHAIAASAPLLTHFHASEPNLVDFSAPVADHEAAAAALRRASYGGWVAIEMLQAKDWKAAVRDAVAWVCAVYGPPSPPPTAPS